MTNPEFNTVKQELSYAEFIDELNRLLDAYNESPESIPEAERALELLFADNPTSAAQFRSHRKDNE